MLKENKDFFQGPGEPTVKTKDKKGIPKPPPLPNGLYRPQLWLDSRLETVTRWQNKPVSMYTFVCAQEFRRDQFADHAKNIHNDVFGGLNNWMEARCPLSVYGCGFSSRRMFPNSKSKTMVFNPAVESFGIMQLSATDSIKTKKAAVVPKAKAKPIGGKNLALTDLPFELLYEIFQQLDSFRSEMSISKLIICFDKEVCDLSVYATWP